jgi:FkbM family methyltransferase
MHGHPVSKRDNSLQIFSGLIKSFLIYYAIPFRKRKMKKLYRRFLKPGGLAFDIGSHLGNRIRVFNALGARVIAVEPFSKTFRFINRFYGKKSRVTCIQAAVGNKSGTVKIYTDPKNPTLSTVSPEWMELVKKTRPFRKVRWDLSEEVPMITLDYLIREYGLPDFCKIDAEGSEDRILSGCSKALPALSIEYLPMEIGTALRCIYVLEKLGCYRYNVSVRETMRFLWDTWRSADYAVRFLENLKEEDSSGDIYAEIKGEGDAG